MNWNAWKHLRTGVLDTALAFSVINRHFDVADFLLAHGADINTRWSSHEPASILHHLVFYGSYESMQFLIDRGIDMTNGARRDHKETSRGWCYHSRSARSASVSWLAAASPRQLRSF